VKILVDALVPFSWAHGGVTVHLNSIVDAIRKEGREVDFLRWWDERQTGDVLLTWYSPTSKISFAKEKNIKIVSYIYLDSLTSKTTPQLYFRKLLISVFRKLFPSFARDLGFCINQLCDAFIFPTAYDASVGELLFQTNRKSSHVIMHGVNDAYMNRTERARGDYLISTGTIHKRKNTLLLAEAARAANIPIVFIGKPYSEDQYFQRFLSLVDGTIVQYKGYVTEEEKIDLLQRARGFASLSLSESGCIAVLEALALKTPVFLPDLGWARGAYENYASFGNVKNKRKLIQQIKVFYESRHGDPHYPVRSWPEVAREYLRVLDSVCEQGAAGA